MDIVRFITNLSVAKVTYVQRKTNKYNFPTIRVGKPTET